MRIASRRYDKQIAVIGVIFAVIALLATATFATINASLFAANMPAPASLSLSEGLYTNGKSYTMRWTPVAGAVKYNYESYNDIMAKSKRAAGVESLSYTSRTNIPEATYYWRVQAIDAQGSTSDWSGLSKVVVDNTPPTSPSISVSGIGVNKLLNTSSITAVWNRPTVDSNTYNLRYSSTAESSQYTAQSPRTIAGITETEWSGPVSEGDGVYTLQVQAVDKAGNQSVWSAPFTYTLDATAPTITLQPIASAQTPATITIDATVNDPSVEKAEILINGNVVKEVAIINGKVSHELSGYEAGTYSVTVQATDAAGNKGLSNAQSAVLTSPPPPVVIKPTPPVETPTTPVIIDQPQPVIQPATNTALARTDEASSVQQTVHSNNLRNIAFATPEESEPTQVVASDTATTPETSITGGLTSAGQAIKGSSDTKSGWSGTLSNIGWLVAAVIGIMWAAFAVRRRWAEEKSA